MTPHTNERQDHSNPQEEPDPVADTTKGPDGDDTTLTRPKAGRGIATRLVAALRGPDAKKHVQAVRTLAKAADKIAQIYGFHDGEE
jgi:hypothetical protein